MKQYAEKFNISECTARNYCTSGKIDGVRLVSKSCNVHANTVLPCHKKRAKVSPLQAAILDQKGGRIKGSFYHRVQIGLIYSSNHIEGSRLTQDQTRYVFETSTISITDDAVKVDDIIETANHFCSIDRSIEHTGATISTSTNASRPSTHFRTVMDVWAD